MESVRSDMEVGANGDDEVPSKPRERLVRGVAESGHHADGGRYVVIFLQWTAPHYDARTILSRSLCFIPFKVIDASPSSSSSFLNAVASTENHFQRVSRRFFDSADKARFVSCMPVRVEDREAGGRGTVRVCGIGTKGASVLKHGGGSRMCAGFKVG